VKEEQDSVTKVIVTGALGRMGRETLAALAKDTELDLAGGVAPHASEEYLDLPAGGGLIPITRDLESLITRVRPRVMVDFTHPGAAMDNIRLALKHKISPVVGTSGIKPEDLSEIERLTAEAGVT
jgi:4-hydroxy-tetrahydrodipicolinate reductase